MQHHFVGPNSYAYGGSGAPNNMNLPQGFPEQVYMVVPPQGVAAQQHQFPGYPRGIAADPNGQVMFPGQVLYQTAQPMQQPQRPMQQQMMMQLPVYQQQNMQYNPAAQWQPQAGYGNMPQPQPPYQQQQQQQQHYKSNKPVYPGPYTGQPMPQSVQQQQPAQSAEQKRQKHKLTFTDPNTGKNVVFGSEEPDQTDNSANAAVNSENSSLIQSTNVVAAEFAAKVAATLAPSQHHSESETKPTFTTLDDPELIVNDDVPQHPPGAPQNLSESESLAESRHVAVSVKSSDETVRSVTPTVESAATVPSSLSSDKSIPVTASAALPDVTPSATIVAADTPVAASESSVDVANCEPITVTSNSENVAPTAPSVKPSLPAEPATAKKEDSTSKDSRKKKNRKKDLNTKAKAGHGSDMDAFIDESVPSAVKDKGDEQVVSEVAAASTVDEVALVASSDIKTQPIVPDETSSAQPVCDIKPEPICPVLTDEPAAEAASTAEAASISDEVTPAASTEPPVVAAEAVPVTVETSPEVSPIDTVKETSIEQVDLPIPVTETSPVTTEEKPLAETPVTTPESDSTTVAASTTDDCSTQPADETVEDVIGESSAEDVLKIPTKSELKYKYAEEQWSPLNPEGKKQYDRNFMLQLQYVATSMTKPANLPPMLDIILNEPPRPMDFTRHKSMELSRPNENVADFTPGFIKSSTSASRRPPRIERSNSSMKKGEPPGGRKVISLQIASDVKLHQADNAWKPILNKKEATDAETQTQELYKKVRGILNKLTPQKFKTLIQQVLTLQIDTEERLKGCIDIIFEKAISEPNFSVAYANMAKCMLALTVPKDSDPKQMVGFRSLLLNKCQQEFEKDKLEEQDMAERQKLIDESTSDDSRKHLVEEQEAAAYRAKRRSLGNIRFIGELFKLRMLTEAIMHDCLMKLLQKYDEDNLECLCQLLTTIGLDLDNKASKFQPRMDKYFQKLDGLVNERKTSARIRFLLLDTIDLRKNNWVPRREKNNPKTIEQIHKEAQEEAQEKQAMIQRVMMEPRGRRAGPVGGGGAGGGGRVCPPSAGITSNDDGWTAVSRPPRSNIVDPVRLKLTKREQVDDNIQLGPGGRGMSTWHRGSSGGGGKVTTPEPDVRQPNRYSLLGSATSESFDLRNRSGPVGRARDYQGRMSGPARSNVGVRASQEPGLDMMIHEDRRHAASRSTSRESPRVTSIESHAREAPVPAPVSKQEKELSPEDLERKTKSLIEEYLHLNSLEEALACVQDLGSSKSLHMFVYHALMLNLERSSQARQRTGVLLHFLASKHAVTVNQYVEGLREVLSLADDMVIDVPKIWQYIGELVSPMLQEENTIPLTFLRSACEPLIACEGGDKAGLVVSMVLRDAVHRLGHHKVAELWQESGLVWSDFIPADQVTNFLQSNDLAFTVEMKAVPSTEKKESSEQLYTELAELLSDTKVENDKVIDWIEENVREMTPEFIRALSKAACSPAFRGGNLPEKEQIDQELVKRRLPLLQKYINHRLILEMEALYAVQLIVHSHGHPYGALRIFFDLLYDDEVVSEEAFYQWRDKPDIGEQTGRGVAKLSVDQFYKWLGEEDIAS